MTDKELEAVKIDIRSTLITQPSYTIEEFRKVYKSVVGQYVPYRKFGYNTEVEFLRSIPDVVRVNQNPYRNSTTLAAVADEQTQHIANLVSKQKKAPTKHRSSVPPRFWSNEAFHMPPRMTSRPPVHRRIGILPHELKVEINRILYEYVNGITLPNLMVAYKRKYEKELDFQGHGFPILDDCLRANTDIALKTRGNDTVAYHVKHSNTKETTNDAWNNSWKSNSNTSYTEKSSVRGQAYENGSRSSARISQSSYHDVNSASYHDVNSASHPTVADRQTTSQSSSTSNANVTSIPHSNPHIQTPPGFASQKRLASQSPLEFNRSDNPFPRTIDSLSDFPDVSARNHHQPSSAAFECGNIPTPKEIRRESTLRLDLLQDDNSAISEAMRQYFLKMLEKYPDGIESGEFPIRYEEVTGHELNLHSIGFFSLIELIDQLPDIFQRRKVPGSKNEFFIYPASSDLPREYSEETSSPVTIELVISNIRNILLAYPEGVKVQDFLQIYNANAKESFNLRAVGFNSNKSLDLDAIGFQDIETFLRTIADDVPLLIDGNKIDGMTIHHINYIANRRSSPYGNVSTLSQLPIDIVPHASRYLVQPIPSVAPDSVNVHQVYVTSVKNPHCLYLQLRYKDMEGELILLGEKIQSFYALPCSNEYKMLDRHVMVGAVCIALWTDGIWYRAQITSIPSLDYVEVFYVDYGNSEKILRTGLRYLRQRYFELPAQALRATFATLRPPNGESQWSERCLARIRKLVYNKRLQAHFNIRCKEDESNIPVLIYDTSEKSKDISVSQALVEEGLAEEIAYCSPSQTHQYAGMGEPNNFFNNYSYPNPVLQAAANYYQTVNQGEVSMNKYLKALTDSNPFFKTLTREQLLMFLHNSMQQGLGGGATSNPFVNPTMSFPHSFQSVPPLASSSVGGFPYGGGVQWNVSTPLTPMHAPTTERRNSDFGLSTSSTPLPPYENSVPESDSESEEFVDDDDDFCKALEDVDPFAQKKIVKRIKISDGYKFHIVVVNNKPYVSCGDVSALLWNNEAHNILSKRLNYKEIVFPTITILEGENNKDMFTLLAKYKVKGIEHGPDSVTSLCLYPLKNVIDILNIFGHSSRCIRGEVDFYLKNFNPDDPTEAAEESEVEEEKKSETDHDKINKLCSYDLKTMQEALNYKKLIILKDLKDGKNPSGVDQIGRIENLNVIIKKRIQEIEELSTGAYKEFAALKL